MNILLTIAFLGTRYHGFQVQQNAVSVCQVLQDAMEKLFALRPAVKGCSRTDSGVHAKQYCLSFHHSSPIAPAKLPLALNTFLPEDIRVLKAEAMPEGFHARYSCKGKTYEYIILNSHVDNPFTKGQYYRVPYMLDAALMQQAAQHLVGKQDFASFMSQNTDIEDTVRHVWQADVVRKGEHVIFSVSADGFLYNMVRIMAGTLLRAGCGRISPADIPGIIAAKNRRNAGDTLPAKGLFLTKVYY